MDGWQGIVGVTVDEWIAADTTAKFADLIARRDNPQPCTVAHREDVEIYDFAGVIVRTARREPCNGSH